MGWKLSDYDYTKIKTHDLVTLVWTMYLPNIYAIELLHPGMDVAEVDAPW